MSVVRTLWSLAVLAPVSFTPACLGCFEIELFNFEGDWGEDDDDDEIASDADWDDDDGDGVEDLPPDVDVLLDDADGILGPDDSFTIRVDDDLDPRLSVELAFATFTRLGVDSGETITVAAADLGDGYGDLVVTAFDGDGWTESGIDGLLIDLSSPVIELSPCVLAANGEGERGALTAWVGDAWVLDRIELTVVAEDPGVPDVVVTQRLPEWPATFGVDWDWSYVTVPATELPLGKSTAAFRAYDRAGNVTFASCAAFVDASAPEVVLAATLVGGTIQISVSAADDDTELPVALVVYAGGAEVAHGQGPTTTLTLDADDFASGPLSLTATGRDRASNETTSNAVVLELP